MRSIGIGVVVSGMVLMFSGESSAQETGNVCVRDYQGGAICTANDVRIESFNPVAIIETCTENEIGVAEMIFEATVTAGEADRYDIGLFISLDENTARDGDDCYHDFFQSGDPAFLDLDEDACGDMAASTEVIKTLQQIRFACVDRNMNGQADISACSSWDNNTNTVCSSVTEAFPGTPAKCGCQVLDLGFEVPVELESFTIER